MTNKRGSYYLLFGFLVLITACKKDCEVIQTNWTPHYLNNDGMAPEKVVLEAEDRTADNYTWTTKGSSTSGLFRDTVTFHTSGEHVVSLETMEGEHSCQHTDVVTIKDYPYLTTDRVLSFFESNGTKVRLVTKVIDFPGASNNIALAYSQNLPENGGGMAYDNEQKKLFAASKSSLFNCFPNGANLEFPITADTFSDRVIYDVTLDPEGGTAYISGSENSSFFIHSIAAYSSNGATTEIHTGALSSDFIYLTEDRLNNVIFWTHKEGDTIYKIENGINEVFLTGGPFYDLDFANSSGLLFYVEDQISSFSIKTIDPVNNKIKTDAKSINGEVSFIYVDEETQELFWANNLSKDIWSKRIAYQMGTAKIQISGVGNIRGLAVGNFVPE